MQQLQFVSILTLVLINKVKLPTLLSYVIAKNTSIFKKMDMRSNNASSYFLLFNQHFQCKLYKNELLVLKSEMHWFPICPFVCMSAE